MFFGQYVTLTVTFVRHGTNSTAIVAPTVVVKSHLTYRNHTTPHYARYVVISPVTELPWMCKIRDRVNETACVWMRTIIRPHYQAKPTIVCVCERICRMNGVIINKEEKCLSKQSNSKALLCAPPTFWTDLYIYTYDKNKKKTKVHINIYIYIYITVKQTCTMQWKTNKQNERIKKKRERSKRVCVLPYIEPFSTRQR